MPSRADPGHRCPRLSAAALIGFIVSVMTSMGAAPSLAAAVPVDVQRPDLVPAPATTVHVEEDTSGDPAVLRLSFDGYVRNAGPGALEIQGRIPVPRDGTTEMLDTFQRLYAGSGRPTEPLFEEYRGPRRPRLVYETSDDHQHFHLKDAVVYELLGDGQPRPFAKAAAGFCLVDSMRFSSNAAAAYYGTSESDDCGHLQPDAPQVRMGIQAGWEDFYPFFLAFQWIDISEVPPAAYSLVEVVDPTDVILEASEDNDAGAPVEVVVPGYLARAASLDAKRRVGTDVTLPAVAVSGSLLGRPALGQPEFRIVQPPEHGTLTAESGVWFEQSQVRYVPNHRFRGQDSFRYEVRDRAFPQFPRTPPNAVITLNV